MKVTFAYNSVPFSCEEVDFIPRVGEEVFSTAFNLPSSELVVDKVRYNLTNNSVTVYCKSAEEDPEYCGSETKIGDIVRFSREERGYPGEQRETRQRGIYSDILYKVTRVEVHDDYTDLYLLGFEKPFNSVLFDHVR